MSYSQYYSGGWQTGESGGTPITPAALNYMESGISTNDTNIAGNTSDITTINNKIGSTTMGTTATTITGAIAEHEGDISTLNSNLTWQSVTLTAGSDVTINSQAAYKRDNLLFVFASITLSSNVSAYTTLLTHGLNARCGWIAPLYSNAKIPVTTTGIYGDAGNTTIRASQPITAGSYQVSCVIPWY